jgi:hypothetical protein
MGPVCLNTLRKTADDIENEVPLSGPGSGRPAKEAKALKYPTEPAADEKQTGGTKHKEVKADSRPETASEF